MLKEGEAFCVPSRRHTPSTLATAIPKICPPYHEGLSYHSSTHAAGTCNKFVYPLQSTYQKWTIPLIIDDPFFLSNGWVWTERLSLTSMGTPFLLISGNSGPTTLTVQLREMSKRSMIMMMLLWLVFHFPRSAPMVAVHLLLGKSDICIKGADGWTRKGED